jgi:thiamine monophosphate synthase
VLGLARAAAIVGASPLTCVGIGGIDAERLPRVLGAGIENFAVVRYVCASDRPADRIRELLSALPAPPRA